MSKNMFQNIFNNYNYNYALKAPTAKGTRVNVKLYTAITIAYALPKVSGLTKNTIPVQAEANAKANEVPSNIRDKNGKTYQIIK